MGPDEVKEPAHIMNTIGAGNLWISQSISLLVIVCVFSCAYITARKMLEDQNLRCCCIVESIWSACECCQGISACMAFGVWTGMATLIPNPTDLCNKMNITATGNTVANAAFLPAVSTTAPIPVLGNATATNTTTALTLPECIGLMGTIHTFMTILCLFAFVTAMSACVNAMICGAGAKFANDTQDDFEDEYSDEE